jgi:hypothetical protein
VQQTGEKRETGQAGGRRLRLSTFTYFSLSHTLLSLSSTTTRAGTWDCGTCSYFTWDNVLGECLLFFKGGEGQGRREPKRHHPTTL